MGASDDTYIEKENTVWSQLMTQWPEPRSGATLHLNQTLVPQKGK